MKFHSVPYGPHQDSKVKKFYEVSNGLFAKNPKTTEKYSKGKVLQLTKVKEILRFLSWQQQEKAEAAKQLYHAVGAPSLDDLKAMIRMNLIHNNKITTKDVNLVLKVFGPDVATIKGKTTRKILHWYDNGNSIISQEFGEIE